MASTYFHMYTCTVQLTFVQLVTVANTRVEMKWWIFFSENTGGEVTQMVCKHINESDRVEQAAPKSTSFVFPREQTLSRQIVPEENAPLSEIPQHAAS